MKKKIIYAVICILTICGLVCAACDNNTSSGGKNVPVSNVTVNQATLTLEVGGIQVLSCSIVPPTATNRKVSWESDNPAVATVVSTSGRVTGISEGEATITVTTEDGFFTDECVVTVNAASLPPRPWSPAEPDTDWVAGTVTIDVYSFNDFHGAVKTGGSDPGAARFAAYAKTQMTASGADRSLILAAGDNYQGSAISNYFNGEPVSKMMQEIGVKYSAVGNHEWDWGPEMYATFAHDGDLDFLAANIFLKGTDDLPDFCHPYVIANRAGRKIGIVGLTTTATPSLVSADNIAQFDYREPGAWLTEMVSTLKTEQGCDAVIALTHMGTTGAGNGEAGALASGGYGFDAVIGAHSHTLTNVTVNGIPVVQAGNNGRNLAKLSFQFNDTGLVSVTGSTNAVGTGGPEDPAVKAMVDEYDALVAPIMSEVVGVFGPSISAGKNPWANKLVFDYIVRVKPEYKDVVLIQNSGGWRTVSSVGGPTDNVTVEFLYQLMPFDNEIYVFDLRGDYLMNLLSGSRVTGSGSVGTSPVNTNASGSGANWTITSSGEKIDPARTYKVSMNDFMYTGGDSYGVVVNDLQNPALTMDYASNLVVMGIPLRDAMIEQLKYRVVNGEGEPLPSQKIGNLTGGPLVAPYEITAANPRYVQDTALIHLINDAMVWYANEKGHNVTLTGTAPLSATANAQEGEITRATLSSIYYYDNNTLYIIEMTGAKFKDWMEWAHWTYHQTNMQSGDLTIPYSGSNGYNFDQFDGLTYKVDLTKNQGSRIVDMKNPDGSAFDLAKTYLVAINDHRIDYEFTNGAIWGSTTGNYTVKAAGIAGLHDVLAEYIETAMDGEITNDFTPSWEFIMPDAEEDWFDEYRALAVQLLNDGTLPFYANTPVTKTQIDAWKNGELADPEPPVSPIKLDFEDSTKWNINAYSSESTITDVGLHWRVRGYGQSPDDNDRKIGTRSWRLRANPSNNGGDDANYVELADFLKYGIQTLSFSYGSYSGHSGGVLVISTQTKGGTWTEQKRITAPAWSDETGMETETVTLNISDPVRFKIEKVMVTGSTSVNIDDIIITYSK